VPSVPLVPLLPSSPLPLNKVEASSHLTAEKPNLNRLIHEMSSKPIVSEAISGWFIVVGF
jgi:hypothetical protein